MSEALTLVAAGVAIILLPKLFRLAHIRTATPATPLFVAYAVIIGVVTTECVLRPVVRLLGG